jgi:anti-anti-sigma factor
MEITVSQEQGRVPVTVFHIQGDIDAQTYEQLEAQVRQAIQDGTHYLLLDMSQVRYVSSYGIRGLSDIFTLLRDAEHGEGDAAISKGVREGSFKSHHLKLLNPTSQVMKVLTTSGMDMFLDIQKDHRQAIDSF